MSVTERSETVGAPVATARPWFARGAPSLLDKLPLFAEAMGKVAAAWSDGFATLTAAPASFAFAGLADSRIAALSQRRGPDPVFALLAAPAWSSVVILQFDRAFVSTALEALFGGEGGDGDAPSGPLSAVELRIAEVVSAQAAGALHAGFADVLPSPFRYDRILAKPDLSPLGRPNAMAVVTTLRIKTLGRSAEVDIIVPRGAIDVFAERLSVVPDDEPATPDPRWTSRLEGGVSRAPMTLSAVVALDPMTLGAIAGLRAGQVLSFPRDAAGDVTLICGGKPLFRCDLGQSAGHLTLRVEGPAVERSSRKDPGLG